ncbi:MAG: polyprenyl diphosphate synthase [Candidatus Kariarchaeaceae archaeon]
MSKQVKASPVETIPQHIGIILDGNRRYAKSIDVPLETGYRIGSDKLEEVLDWLWDINVRVVSVWVFSTENFDRDIQQVGTIMQMAEDRTIRIREDKKVHKRGVQIRYSGDLSRLPTSLQDQIQRTEQATEKYENHILNICLAYGGRAEITHAMKKIASQVQSGNLDVEEINEAEINKHLYTSGLPDPDLIIRTSGSVRLSGFMLWQASYSELYFTDVLWPSFRHIDLLRAVRDFQARKRNFGS